MSSSGQDTPQDARPEKKPLSKGLFLAILAAMSAALLVSTGWALSDMARRDAADYAQDTVAFARQSVRRHEENISRLRTKNTTSVWEKLEELESRFDLADDADTEQIQDYIKKMNLQTVFLLDENRLLAASVGDADTASFIAGELRESEVMAELVDYPARSYLTRMTLDGSTYDLAACVTSSLKDGIVVAVSHVEKSDVEGGQAMFNAMFDNYSLNMDGTVVVADGEQVLASSDTALHGMSLDEFKGRLVLDANREPDALGTGTFDGVSCYGLKTTSNGYSIYVWFPASAVMTGRNVVLAVISALCLIAILGVFVARANVQNTKLRREHEYLEDLERANAAKTDFLRRMSHDVRTPINGIRGMLAIGDHYADDMAKQAECREKMWEASSFLLDLVNSALDMNKLESGEMRLDNRPFDLQKAVESVNDVLEISADNASIAFSAETSIDHPHVIGSSLHVRQVLQNIGSNAIKYNRAGGSVHMVCRELDAEDGQARFLFACQDTGIGMSEEFQRRAFEAFSQEDSGSRATYRGTGLGLAISKEIVDQMGGTIRFTSFQGQGTRFEIELSFRIDENTLAEDTGEEAGDEARSASLKGMRVLLAEDNDLNTEIALFMLGQEGVVADTAVDGREALEKFKRSPNGYYDAILMDEMMPRMSGTEAAREIRLLQRPDAMTVPIIAVTANAFSEDRDASAAAGMNDHVSKPLDAESLAAALRRNRN